MTSAEGDDDPTMDDNHHIKLLLSDVDGTLMTPDDELTPATIESVRDLHEMGVDFAIASGRPPRGMLMLVEPLRIVCPIAAFNGGTIVNPDMSLVSQKAVPGFLIDDIFTLVADRGLEPWAYSGSEWYVLDDETPHVRQHATTMGFEPEVVSSFDGVDEFGLIVGVGDDHDAVRTAELQVRESMGVEVSVSRSQPYYVDVTHPDANKGAVSRFMIDHFGLETSELASIGDGPNDIAMFANSGVGMAMGNASKQVQASAEFVTDSNDEDGFANAVRHYLIDHNDPVGGLA